MGSFSLYKLHLQCKYRVSNTILLSYGIEQIMVSTQLEYRLD